MNGVVRAWLWFGLLMPPLWAADEVDVIEVNDFGSNRPQLIFWEQCEQRGRRVVDWRWLSDPATVPIQRNGIWVLDWMDDQNGRDGTFRRRVYAREAVWTKTEHDPESADKKHWPEASRRRLVKPPLQE